MSVRMVTCHLAQTLMETLADAWAQNWEFVLVIWHMLTLGWRKVKLIGGRSHSGSYQIEHHKYVAHT